MDHLQRHTFEGIAQGSITAGDDLGELAYNLAERVHAQDESAARSLAALVTRVAVTDPADLVSVYNGAAQGWLAQSSNGPVMTAPPLAATPPDDAFWTAFWALVLDPTTGSDPGDITLRTAGLTGQLAPELRHSVAALALAFPGVADAAASGSPIPFTLAALAACPRGSLGSELHDLVVVNGFDLEVLDRNALALTELPDPLHYLNSRILQCHDVWHKVGGYETTVLHEVAISAFQMAQFGHHYSSMFLAVTLTKVAFEQPFAVGLILDTVLSAWSHGRATPPMLGVEWERLWHLPIVEIRRRLGITAYQSPHAADLIEQLGAA